MKMTASITDLKRAFAFYADNPAGCLRVDYGEYWGAEEFRRWFRKCLAEKINREDKRTGRKLTPDFAANLRSDATVINDRARFRIRRAGRNILLTPELKRRYPEIDNSPWED